MVLLSPNYRITTRFLSLRSNNTGAPARSVLVNSNADSGIGTLRNAILQVNALDPCAGPVAINFNLPDTHRTIRPLSPFPRITRVSVAIDARTQPGWNGHPRIEIDGSSAGEVADWQSVDGLLMIDGAADCLVAGLVLNRFSGLGLCSSSMAAATPLPIATSAPMKQAPWRVQTTCTAACCGDALTP